MKLAKVAGAAAALVGYWQRVVRRIDAEPRYTERLKLLRDVQPDVAHVVRALRLAKRSADPRAATEILARGYEISCHGYRWLSSKGMSEAEEREWIDRAVKTIRDACGVRPVGWHTRCPHTPNTRRLLIAEGGFLYDSDAYDDDLPYLVDVGGREHVVLPYSLDTNDMRFQRPEAGFVRAKDFAEYVIDAFDWLHRTTFDDGNSFPATGDDRWQPWLINYAYGSDYPAVEATQPGKNLGFTDWTHGDCRAADPAPPAPEPTEEPDPEPTEEPDPEPTEEPDPEPNRRWMTAHRHEYAGQWVALDGDRLIAHGANPNEVFASARADGAYLPLVTFIPPVDALPFAGV